MNIAIDIYYTPNGANCVGMLFDWQDERPAQIIKAQVSPVSEYVPGQFYKRELPCIMAVLNKVDLDKIDSIVVDGYVYIDNQFAYGLGGHLWEDTGKKISVIGVAKRKYFNNEQSCLAILRNESKIPLYVSSIGMEVAEAAEKVRTMHGEYRIPHILKQLDQETKVAGFTV